MIAKLLTFGVIIVVALFFFVPAFRQFGARLLTTSELITLPGEDSSGPSETSERQVKLVTLLGFDAIPAILDPDFVSPNAGRHLDGTHRAGYWV